MRFKTTIELDVDVEFSAEASEPDVGYVGGVTLERVTFPKVLPEVGGWTLDPTDLPEDVQAALTRDVTEYLEDQATERANDEAERRRDAELDEYYDRELHLRDRGRDR